MKLKATMRNLKQRGFGLYERLKKEFYQLFIDLKNASDHVQATIVENHKS